ncbi:MAG TPA: hypothetical protein VK729_05140, partial [Silvibacterium sp.]|nr:hypothetical protein [Silvibacterium sp.]
MREMLGLVRTASYSKNKFVVAGKVYFCSKAASTNRLDAPTLLRTAATITDVIEHLSHRLELLQALYNHRTLAAKSVVGLLLRPPIFSLKAANAASGGV